MKQSRPIADFRLLFVGLVTGVLFPFSAMAADWMPIDASRADVPVPKSLDDKVSIELVAAEPDIVTPRTERIAVG